MPTVLSIEDLDNIIEGAAFMGSGGGGPLPLARSLLATMKQQGMQPTLVEWGELPANFRVATTAGIGSPNAAETVQSPFTIAPKRMIEALESALGYSIECLIPGETGPMNSLIPMMAAAQLGKPVLNGDGAGRAMSTLAMSTFNAVASIQPYLLGNETETPNDQVTASLTVHTPEQADALTRGIVSEGLPGLTLYALNESMMAWRDDLPHPLAVGPDSLCWVTETGIPFTNATLDDYMSASAPKLHLIGLSAVPQLLTSDILAAYRAALTPLGYPGPYQPLSYWKEVAYGY